MWKRGAGGNGSASFRREKFIPRGGPDGGDGGRGGDVVLLVNPNQNTLVAFEYAVHFKARPGVRARPAAQGRAGSGEVIAVPPGTTVRDAETGALIADLTEAGHGPCRSRRARRVWQYALSTSTHRRRAWRSWASRVRSAGSR